MGFNYPELHTVEYISDKGELKSHCVFSDINFEQIDSDNLAMFGCRLSEYMSQLKSEKNVTERFVSSITCAEAFASLLEL